jgi:S-adenosylmethionine-diacylglycerol 3-amino-3-carboxypropyl transferase
MPDTTQITNPVPVPGKDASLTSRSEIAAQADFSEIRYAQCWEDADILLEGLDVQPGDTCLSIASAGDNTLALLSKQPAHVIALDMSAAQLACLELRVAAYRTLAHGELLELMGSRPSTRRADLYRRCRNQLTPEVRRFWDARSSEIAAGIGGAGKFERYFALFRRRLLPLVHSRASIARLLHGGTYQERQVFYEQQWDTWRWRTMFQLFFSRAVLGRKGRDPRFFQYVDEGNVADRLLARVRQGLTWVNTAQNPYIQWILTGHHTTALPYALRAENFEAIRANLDRLEWRRSSLEDFLSNADQSSIDRFNLSDVFEYMSEENYIRLLEQLVRVGRPAGRLAYWNMLVPRSRPAVLASSLHPHAQLAQSLHQRDKACFYSAFIIEEILK